MVAFVAVVDVVVVVAPVVDVGVVVPGPLDVVVVGRVGDDVVGGWSSF